MPNTCCAITVPNWTEDDRDRLIRLIQADEMLYLILGKETAATGMKHLQGCFMWSGKASLAEIRAKCGKGHITRCKKALTVNIIYCKKDGDFQEWGDPPAKKPDGRKEHLLKLKELIDEGTSMVDLRADHLALYSQYYRGVTDYHRDVACAKHKSALRDVTVEYVWGPTGTGKSHYAYHHAIGDTYRLVKSQQMAWFDGYNGEGTLVLDDYTSWWNISYLLNLLDKYPLQLPIKGGHVWAEFTCVIITSNLELHEQHTKAGERHRDALKRRVDKVTWLQEAYVEGGAGSCDSTVVV